MIQTAWGLHYVHGQGLVHQDFKPRNLMMTADGTAKAMAELDAKVAAAS